MDTKFGAWLTLRTTFVSQFDIYSRRSDTQGYSSFSLGERVVLSVCDTYVHSHRLIIFENFFTSYQLLRSLNERGLYGVGTVRGSRKGLPDILKRKDQMQHGEFMFRTKVCVTAIKWQDNKPVTVLSTYQASNFGEMNEKRWYIIDYSLPHRGCRVQFNNGRSRSL